MFQKGVNCIFLEGYRGMRTESSENFDEHMILKILTKLDCVSNFHLTKFVFKQKIGVNFKLRTNLPMIFLFPWHRSFYVVFFAYHMKQTFKLKHYPEVVEHSLPRAQEFDSHCRSIFNLFQSKGQLEPEATLGN